MTHLIVSQSKLRFLGTKKEILRIYNFVKLIKAIYNFFFLQKMFGCSSIRFILALKLEDMI